MKNISKTYLILTIAIFSFNVAESQSIDIDNKDDIVLPPLQVVIDSVLHRNGMLKYRKQEIGVKESTLASERIYWTKNLGFDAQNSYGNTNNNSTNFAGISNTSAVTTTTQFSYSVGLYLKIPIYDLINRKHQVHLARFELDAAKSMAQFQEDEIRQTIIKMYQDLIFKQKILKIKSKSLGDNEVNMQMVEKEFRNGVVPVAEYVRITSIASNVEADYESAMSEFIIAKKLLEDMAGFVFN